MSVLKLVKKEQNTELIDTLKDVLARAEKGEVISAIMVLDRDDGCIERHSMVGIGTDTTALFMALDRIKFRYMMQLEGELT